MTPGAFPPFWEPLGDFQGLLRLLGGYYYYYYYYYYGASCGPREAPLGDVLLGASSGPRREPVGGLGVSSGAVYLFFL